MMLPDRHDAPEGATPPEAGHARAARLEARLAVYAQYAAVVTEQAAAAVGGDARRAEALAAERERVAEHFSELQGATAAGAPSFRAALDESLAELTYQGAVDVALAQRLVSLRDAVVRGAAWAAGEPAVPARRALPSPSASADPAPHHAPPPAAPDPLDRASLENALVAARAARVGGALAGQYPGRGTRDEWPAGWSAADAAGVGAPEPPDGPRLDVRF